MTFIIFSRRDWRGRKRWYFRLKSSNGQIVAQSEGYANRADCLTTINSIRNHAYGARVEVLG